ELRLTRVLARVVQVAPGDEPEGGERTHHQRPDHEPEDAARAALTARLAHPRSAASVFSSEAASSTLSTSTDLSMRLTMPASALPGPTSTIRVTPSFTIACTHSIQRTEPTTCATSSSTMRAAS